MSVSKINLNQHGAELSAQDQKNLICGILAQVAADPDAEVLFGYLRHCGLPVTALRTARDILPAFLALYRVRKGRYDVDRACEDLRHWPPIAARIEQLMQAEGERRGTGRSEVGKFAHDL